MKKLSIYLLGAALILGSLTLLFQRPSATYAFQDMDKSAWYYTCITELAQDGYLIGREDGSFGIGDQLSLGEFSAMLSNAFYGETLAQLKNNTYDTWWEPYVLAVSYRGGLYNTTALTYYKNTGNWGSLPTQPLNRYDMASMVTSLLLSRGLPSISDTQVSEICASLSDNIATSYQREVATAYYYKILTGREDNCFDGDSALNRQEGAAVLYALLKSPLTTEENYSNYQTSPPDTTTPDTSTPDTTTPDTSTPDDSYSGVLGGTSGNITDLHEYVLEVFRLVNEERANYGLTAFTLDSALCALAQYKSDEMSALNYLSHTSPTYGEFSNILTLNGITVTRARENLARGQHSPAEVVEDWMNSTDHRTNILAIDVGKIGIGYTEEGYYWSQLFTNIEADTGGDLSDDLGGSQGSGGHTSGNYKYAMEVPYYQYDNYFEVGYAQEDCLVYIPVDNTGDYSLVFDNLELSGTDAFYFTGFVSVASISVGERGYVILEPMGGLPVGAYTVTVEFSVENLPSISQTITIYIAEQVFVPDVEEDDTQPEFTLPEDLIPTPDYSGNTYTVYCSGMDTQDITVLKTEQIQGYYDSTGETCVMLTLSESLPEGVSLKNATVSYQGATIETARMELSRNKIYIIFQNLPYSNQMVELNLSFQEGYRVVQNPAPISMTVLINDKAISPSEYSPFPVQPGDTLEVIIPESNLSEYLPQIKNSEGDVLSPDYKSNYGSRSTGVFVVDDQDFYIIIADNS